MGVTKSIHSQSLNWRTAFFIWCRMMNSTNSLVMHGSRLKFFPIPLVVFPIFVMWYWLVSKIAIGFHYASALDILIIRPVFALPFLVIAWLGLWGVSQTISPPCLTLTATGWTLKGLMSSKSFRWENYHEPRLVARSGRGKITYRIELMAMEKGKVAVIPAEIFKTDHDSVFRLVTSARNGIPADDYPEDYLSSYTASTIVSVIVFFVSLTWFVYLL